MPQLKFVLCSYVTVTACMFYYEKYIKNVTLGFIRLIKIPCHVFIPDDYP